jgi:hypothetical protein
MGFYKVNFSGYAIVKADSEEEAMEIYDSEDIYTETKIDDVEKADNNIAMYM